eukprot:tig00000145_g8830.t1
MRTCTAAAAVLFVACILSTATPATAAGLPCGLVLDAAKTFQVVSVNDTAKCWEAGTLSKNGGTETPHGIKMAPCDANPKPIALAEPLAEPLAQREPLSHRFAQSLGHGQPLPEPVERGKPHQHPGRDARRRGPAPIGGTLELGECHLFFFTEPVIVQVIINGQSYDVSGSNVATSTDNDGTRRITLNAAPLTAPAEASASNP